MFENADDELADVTIEFLPHNPSQTATSSTNFPPLLRRDSLLRQVNYTNVSSLPGVDNSAIAPRQPNDFRPTIDPQSGVDNSAPTIVQQSDTDISTPTVTQQSATDISTLTVTQQSGTDISTQRQTRSSGEGAKEQRSEHRHGEDQSRLGLSTLVAADINDASIHPPTSADAEALLANAGCEQRPADDVLSLTSSEDTEMMSMMSSTATRRQESHTTESGGDSNGQASTSATASSSASQKTR